jgi:hypothetical protein
MVPLTALWLPIILSAILVFAVSALVWTVLKIHDADWKALPGEDRIYPAMREARIQPGQYYFPAALREGEKDPAVAARLQEGGSGYVFVRGPASTDMRRSIVYALLHNLVIAYIVAYIAGRALAPGTDYLEVFRIVGTAALLAYASAHITYAIWFAHSWRSTWKQVAEGVVYALLMAGVFGWLWPS